MLGDLPVEPMKLRKIIGSNIRDRRSVLGLTQGDLAESFGSTADRVSRIEAGATGLDFSEVPGVAQALDLPNPLVLFEENIFRKVPSAHPKLQWLD